MLRDETRQQNRQTRQQRSGGACTLLGQVVTAHDFCHDVVMAWS